MAVEKKFVLKAVNQQLVKEYLEKELRSAGISTITIQKTPLATRIAMRVRRPSVVIGKKGSNIKTISDRLSKEFGIENPQLDVIEVEKPELDAKLVAERIGRQIEIEGNIKQVMRFNLRDMVNAGVMGCEIIVAGKVVGKGGKAKTLRMRAGYLKKSGEVKKLVQYGSFTAYLKAGAIGIKVRLVLPGTQFPDHIKIDYDKMDADDAAALAAPLPDGAAAIIPEDAQAKAAEAKLKEKVERARREAAERKRRRPVRKPKASQGVKDSGHAPQILTARDEPAPAQRNVESAPKEPESGAAKQG